MDPVVFLAVLVAAAFHAGWNALLKLRLEPMAAVSLISAAGGLVTLPLAAFIDLPQPAAWGYLAASLAIHLVYYVGLTEAYRHGDLGQVYPIARGSARCLPRSWQRSGLESGLVCSVGLASACSAAQF